MRVATAAGVLLLGSADPASTAGPAPAVGRVKREVLALYDSAYTPGPRDTTVHALAEMPLNHLGLVVRYHDLRTGLPPATVLDDIRGVVTWFESDAIPAPRAYLRWLEGLGRSGTPLVSLGAPGGTRDERGAPLPLDDVNRAFAPFGWRFEGGWHTTTSGTSYTVRDARLVGFERQLPRLVPPYTTVRAVGREARAVLSVSAPARPAVASDLLIVGPRGAFVSPGFAYFADRSDSREFRQWYINPFELFRAVFDTDRVPKPDTATLSGRRIYYSHVDGDGWRNLTQIEPYRSRYAIAARVVLEEVVRKFPDLPVSIGAIVGDLDPAWKGTQESRDVARTLYGLAHVEPAIHTYSHPLEWGHFDAHGSGRDAKDRATRVIGPDVLHDAGPVKPRVYDTRPFSLATEIDEASAYLTTLLPPGRRVGLLQWSGDTRPFEGALAHVRRAGLANINGGDTRFDREFPSTAWVSPLGTRIGGELQVYASNSNENTYTDLWRDRFFGFTFLARTVRNTGSPRRLKPFNVYYHMYSGERLSSLNAVLANLEYARSLPLAPIEASRFSRIVEGFYSTTFESEGPRRWRVRNRGSLQSVRFDGASLEGVDLAASSGVIGQRHELGSLFVALDEAIEAPLIVLKPIAPAEQEPAEDVAYLVDSRWRVYGVRRDATGIRFQTEGYGPGESSWHWPYGPEALVRWRAVSGRSGDARVSRDASGVMTVRLPMLTGERLEVTLTSGGVPRATH
jgi:hypothetical protein